MAVAIGSQYCQRHPEHSPALLFFGRALAEVARYAEARVALGRGLACAPTDRRATFLAQLGHLEALAGDFTGAESWYVKASAEASTDAEERLYLGEIRYRQGRLADGEAAIRPVTEIWNESLGEGLYLLGNILASQGRYGESLEAFSRAAEASPDCRRYARKARELARIVRRRGSAAT